ncbi:hypothetical protein AB1Y20_009198 [Prymnesium parvum]|uniref:HAT C-terminal dimerisation domain-containing protein n=1 Tax=Prymnesium parvum TaxID=97485 RepID=A0AB34K508_PRYPA
MQIDWLKRWVVNLEPSVKRVYALATLLHPGFKTYDFIEGLEFIPATDKDWALRELRSEWKFVWKVKGKAMMGEAPTITPAEPTTNSTTEELTTTELPATEQAVAGPSSPLERAAEYTKKRKVSLCGLLRDKNKAKVADSGKQKEVDELEEYLAEPQEDTEINVLAWWQARETRWPCLAKMVKQYFASPASSGGIERVFSAAGKMHSDLKKASKDSTLQHSLFAAYNTV